MNPITLILVIACALVGLALGKTVDIFLAPPFLVAAVIIGLSLKMANAWQKYSGEVCRGRQDLCRSSRRPATACREPHLRDDKGTRHHDPDPDVDGRQHEPCLGSGACGPKGSWRGVGVAKERRLNNGNGDPDQPARCHRQH